MTSPPPELVGVQRPRIQRLPPNIHSTSGQEFIELSRSVGLELDDWQQYHVRVAVAEREDSTWACSEYVDVDPRQNGKGGIIEALKLGFMFLHRSPLVLYSAHEFKTSSESFLRLLRWVDGSDELRRMVHRVWTSHGSEGIELTKAAGGGRLRYIARSNGSGRGFSAPVVFLDEAFKLDGETMAALLPTLSAQQNPWIGYFSSAAKATSSQLHHLRRRALSGAHGRMAYLEHSADPDLYGGRRSAGWAEARRDPQVWAMANPALGIRISVEAVQTELDTLPPEIFDRERLGVPDDELGAEAPVISGEQWLACADPGSQVAGPLVLVVDMPPDRARVTLAAGGRRADGLTHVEVIKQLSPREDLSGEVARLLGAHEFRHVLLVPGGPAGGVLPDVEQACRDARPGDDGVLRLVGSGEFVQACGRFFDLVTADPPAVRHLGQEVLGVAVAAGRQKVSGDAWRWARQSSSVDISPLCGVSVAAWAVDALPEPGPVAAPEAFVLFG